MKVSDVNISNATQRVGNVSSAQATGKSAADTESSVSRSEKIKQMNGDANKEDKTVIDDEMLQKSVEQANKSLENYNRYIERSVHEKTKAVMYVMKDSKTDEVIREFPPKKIQDMIAKMWELAGLFVDEKA